MVKGMIRPQLLYVGFFRLPDLNAAAQRVMANAKALRLLGYDVVLAEVGTQEGGGGPIHRLPNFEGFECYRLPMKQKNRLEHPRTSIYQVRQLMNQLENLRGVIAYNYPAIPLAKLALYCRNRDIFCAADVTEWYGTNELKFGFGRILKWIDTSLRMRLIHKRLDALIVISKYLEDFYTTSKRPVVIRIPPLVDVTDTKWQISSAASDVSTLKLIYAGSPSASKERLDLAVIAVSEAAKKISVHLEVVGITESQFREIYSLPAEEWIGAVKFHGKVSHQHALRMVSSADFSIIIRERSRLTDAGFPTKFVESISLGTPVLTTDHPDLSLIINGGDGGLVVALDELEEQILGLKNSKSVHIDSSMFDISRFENEFVAFSRIIEGKIE